MPAFILDTETTGLDEPQPVEVAWLRCEGPEKFLVQEATCTRYRPSKPIALGALATHHIMDEDLADCTPHTELWVPGDMEYLIGHNVDFDWVAIGRPEVKRIDTCALARKLWPRLDSHAQGALLYHLDRRGARDYLKKAHNALVDAWNCARLLQHILPAVGSPSTWHALWQISEDARIPELMPYGKHKGLPIAEVPSDYKAWLLRQPDVDQYLQIALRGGRPRPAART